MFCLAYNSASLLRKLLFDKTFPTFQKLFLVFKVMKFGTLVTGICIARKKIIVVVLYLLKCYDITYQQIGPVLCLLRKARLDESGLNSKYAQLPELYPQPPCDVGAGCVRALLQ